MAQPGLFSDTRSQDYLQQNHTKIQTDLQNHILSGATVAIGSVMAGFQTVLTEAPDPLPENDQRVVDLVNAYYHAPIELVPEMRTYVPMEGGVQIRYPGRGGVALLAYSPDGEASFHTRHIRTLVDQGGNTLLTFNYTAGDACREHSQQVRGGTGNGTWSGEQAERANRELSKCCCAENRQRRQAGAPAVWRRTDIASFDPIWPSIGPCPPACSPCSSSATTIDWPRVACIRRHHPSPGAGSTPPPIGWWPSATRPVPPNQPAPERSVVPP
jgi:hypothetical protein